MTLTQERRILVQKAVGLLDRVPDDMWVEVKDCMLGFQGNTQSNAAYIRSLFPGVFWRKAFIKGACNWWEYYGNYEGVDIKIYAVSEAPPTCKAVTRIVEFEEEVPTAFAMRLVKRKVVEWDCGNEIPA